MKPPLSQGSPDNFQTPPEAIKPLLPYLKKDWLIWECACGKGYLVDAFKKQGYSCYGSDIQDETDFLKQEPIVDYDVIITNPPYSIKQRFLERCYGLKKPFALLLPLTTLETAKRQRLFKDYGVELILFDKRINFETPNKKNGGSWFATMWVTNGLNIGKQLTFTTL